MICEYTVERNMALVILEIPKAEVVEIVQDVSVTFPDMLGTIGGLDCYINTFC